MSRARVLLIALAVALLCVLAAGRDVNLRVRANAYRSRRTLSPVNYYQLPVCKPEKEVMRTYREHPSIGEVLTGNRLVPTLYDFAVDKPVQCATLCAARFDAKAVRRANYMIANEYDVRMFLDETPLLSLLNGTTGEYRRGFRLGVKPKAPGGVESGNILHNHLEFTVRLHSSKMTEEYTSQQVIGFKVVPRSYSEVTKCTEDAFEAKSEPFVLPRVADKELKVPLTYSVTWERSTEEYPVHRSVTEETQRRGHKIAALYGVLLAVLASVIVAFVMLRTVRKDLAVYLDEELDETEAREESGWKLVRGDVFRPPQQAAVLATAVGAGAQIAVTMLASMFLFAVHAIDATHRGNFLTTVISIFLMAHVVAGFVTARLLKLFNMGSWKFAFLCTMAFPLALGCGVMTLNMVQWMKRSTGAIPFLTVLYIVFLWLLVSLPFGCAGVFYGLKMETIAVTAKISSIPRLIPQESASLTVYYVIAGSLFPFIACCVELSFALNAFWREESMYLYSFLTFFSCTLCVLCAEVGIVVTYFTLRGEDYRWWWRSYASLALAGVYVFIYSAIFLKRSLQIRAFSAIILFLGYMLGVSIMFGMAIGSVGFLGSLWLVQMMYGSIKAD